ncbi:MAG: winged helix-turn-helix domain-containing protein [Pyrinomonadaceae bacterium]
MSLETNSFEFGEFFLDGKERILFRDQKPVRITPKALMLLLALLENRGHIVEKEVLMKHVWADSFVEEGNLAFTMNLLRKALGDDPHHPRFIETVARRGYRFIGDAPEPENGNGPLKMLPPDAIKSKRFRWRRTTIMLAAAVILCAAFVGSWNSASSGSEASAPILLSDFNEKKLSTNGAFSHSVISRDGKNVFYVNKSRGLSSVWVRQLEISSNLEIIPPSCDFYGGLSLSPDGGLLYFARAPQGADGQLDIFRVSIFGGVPEKIISETQGWLDISSDGRKVSFVRCYYRDDENCSLWIADAETGKNEIKLAVRPKPFRIGANRISPDGKSVAFAAGQSENQANEFTLMKVSTENGKENEITAERFFNIKGIAWLPNQSGLLFTASRMPSVSFQIWRVSAGSGSLKPLTMESEAYSNLSMDGEGNSLVATKVANDFKLYVYQMENPAVPPVTPADATSLDFADDNTIVFSSRRTGNDEIWTMGADGSGLRQLTGNAADNINPTAAAGGRFIYFTSNRTGEAHVWRMNADGSMPLQMTTGEGGFSVHVSADSRWIYYLSSRERSLRRVSADGLNDEFILKAKTDQIAFASDGLRAAYLEKLEGKRSLTVVSIPDARIISRFPAADPDAQITGIDWAADGKHLAYVMSGRGSERNTLWYQPMGEGLPFRVAELGDGQLAGQSGLSLSPGGKRFAVLKGGWKHDAVLFTGLK